MAKADATNKPGAGHGAASVRARVSEDHETWNGAAAAGAEKPEYSDDVAGETSGILEPLPGLALDENLPDGVAGLVSGHLLTASPWAWVLRLSTVYEDESRATYTGWLAAPNVVVTCALCLFDPSRGAAREVLVTRTDATGLAGPRSIRSSEFRVVKGWVNSADPEYDYGAILLPEGGLTGIGHFGLAWLPGARPRGEWLNSSGYPWDIGESEQWYEGFQVTDADDRFLWRRGGSRPLAEGSPLWLHVTRNGRAQRYVCGMMGSNSNRGEALRLHRDFYNNLLSWKNGNSGNGQAPGG